MIIRAQAYDSLTRFTRCFLVLASASVMADTEIHRCALDDGTVAFQEKPCAGPTADAGDPGDVGMGGSENEAPAANDDAFDFVNPFDEPAGTPTPVAQPLPERLSKDRAACEKTTREAIDAIDLKLRETGDRPEQDRQHLAELLELTRQLRACKAL